MKKDSHRNQDPRKRHVSDIPNPPSRVSRKEKRTRNQLSILTKHPFQKLKLQFFKEGQRRKRKIISSRTLKSNVNRKGNQSIALSFIQEEDIALSKIPNPFLKDLTRTLKLQLQLRRKKKEENCIKRRIHFPKERAFPEKIQSLSTKERLEARKLDPPPPSTGPLIPF